MARRSDHSREELRAMALKAGREIIMEQGVKNLTTRAVAKRMGYSPGTLYMLFENADDLKFAINVGTLVELRHRLDDQWLRWRQSGLGQHRSGCWKNCQRAGLHPGFESLD